MKVVLQRVLKSELVIEKQIYSKIERGFLVLLGITDSDTEADARCLAEKIMKLRVFEDAQNKMNLALFDIGGALHVVSQFTLYADCKKGNRPSFIEAASPEKAIPLYEKFIEFCKEMGAVVETGKFGADMKINFTNDGPVTIMLESVDGKIK